MHVLCICTCECIYIQYQVIELTSSRLDDKLDNWIKN